MRTLNSKHVPQLNKDESPCPKGHAYQIWSKLVQSEKGSQKESIKTAIYIALLEGYFIIG